MSKDAMTIIKEKILKNEKINITEYNLNKLEEIILESLSKEEIGGELNSLFYNEGYKHVIGIREYEAGFKSRLLYSYTLPICHLEIFVENCLSISNDFLKQYKNDGTSLYNALIRLYGTATLVSKEILSLIKSGFASGAFARWRTLFEISVFSVILSKYGENISKKYLEYSEFEKIRESKRYIKYEDILQLQPLSKKVLKSLERQKVILEKKYGKTFLNENGWASEIFDDKLKKKISFFDILQKTDQEIIYPYYSFACNYIHASPKGFYNIGMLYGVNSEVVLSAQSNIGFTDPAQLMMYSFLIATEALVSIKPDRGMLLRLFFLKLKIKEIAKEFHDAEKEIEKTERDELKK